MISPEKPDPTAVFVPDNKDFLLKRGLVKIIQSLFRAEYLSKFEKQLPTWLANIVNVLIVLGAVLSILACPIWVYPLLTVASLSRIFLPMKK